ncbi:MAG TPA: hypothetical protein VNQ80_03315 [Parapedobacter sp.]|uniref:hypothetical protein n=1 Tax=Parapedobacter sp. TaxID=1958893 RepID=UPI002BA76801|nr:hypothetical protein [Parapedobacter sp.]HWK56337.1 hypothetical protein [Parapedobacter sp.]
MAISLDSSLNEQQLMMLRLFKKPLPEADFQELRKLAVKLLSKRLDETVEAWETDKEIDDSYYDKLSKGHFRKSKQ